MTGNRIYVTLGRPVSGRTRLFLVIALVTTALIYTQPLWTMAFQSNQYPDPLRLAIHISRLEGQKTALRDDLREINSLNHYIGMRPLLESDFSELQWMPLAVGFFALLALRVIALGRVRDLADITVMFTYFGLYGAWDFYNRLRAYGHNLAPDAAIKVDPFTPPFFGKVKIANFWVESYPGAGSLGLLLFGGLLVLALALELRRRSGGYEVSERAA